MPPNFTEIVDATKLAVHELLADSKRVMTLDDFKVKSENKFVELFYIK
jgi:hypothetical protein